MAWIYYADVSLLNDQTLFERAVSLLPEFRQKKIASLVKRDAQILSAGAWMLLESVLAANGYDVSNLTFDADKYGKPFIQGADIHFSLSHSGDMAACVLSRSPVGIDIQYKCDYNPDICRRFFAPGEKDIVFAQNTPEATKDMFFRIWTLKESYVKMTGRGIADFLHFEVAAGDPPFIMGVGDECRLFEFEFPGYAGAVCTSDRSVTEPEQIHICGDFNA